MKVYMQTSIRWRAMVIKVFAFIIDGTTVPVIIMFENKGASGPKNHVVAMSKIREKNSVPL